MINAFVAYSFKKADEPTVEIFKKYFDGLKKTLEFNWEDAQDAQVRPLSDKVKKKMEDKNLFIGIITKKHIEFEDGGLCKLSFGLMSDKYILNKKDCSWGTSYWIIQESGYSLGKGMRVLFLIEKGVRDIDGLHADTEFIAFERGKESECFNNLMVAIGNLIRELKGDKNVPRSQEPTSDAKVNENKVEDTLNQPSKSSEKPLSKMGDEECLHQITFAIIEKNNTKMEELKAAFDEKYKGDINKKRYWQGKILHLESVIGNKSILDDLRKLKAEESNNPDICYWIGRELEKYLNYNEAVIEYLNAESFSGSIDQKMSMASYAADATARSDKKEKALQILLKFFDQDIPQTLMGSIFRYLSDTAKILKEDNLYIAFAEKSLFYAPVNDSLRFDLAYKYSQLNKNEFALHHYKILIKNQPNGGNLNNLAVAYENLKMDAKAVKYYKDACEQYNHTLSMANIAQKYLNEGFVDDATEWVNKAIACKEYERDNVGRVLTRIDSVRTKENEKESEVLQATEGEVRFNLEYAEAYAVPFKKDYNLDGAWTSPHGAIKISLGADNIIKGNGEELVNETPPYLGFGALYLAGITEAPKEIKKKIITLTGKIIRNMVIEYKIRIEVESQTKSLSLFSPDNTEEYNGVGIIDTNKNIIKIKESDKNNKISFYELTKN